MRIALDAHSPVHRLARWRIAQNAPHTAQDPLKVRQHGFLVLGPVGGNLAGRWIGPLIVRQLYRGVEAARVAVVPVLHPARDGVPGRAVHYAIREIAYNG